MGFLLGYGLKKIATVVFKIIALICAFFTLAMTWLASTGIITVNYNVFTNTVGSTLDATLAALVSSLTLLAQVLPMGGSFGLGFYIGAKKG
jgi:uncharacterized membrane protein (Fun14 family)